MKLCICCGKPIDTAVDHIITTTRKNSIYLHYDCLPASKFHYNPNILKYTNKNNEVQKYENR